MSKFDLRDISDRLARSHDTEAVVFEFLGYLQSMRSDWRATLAFYEVSADALVNLYERQGNRLVRRELSLPVDQLPARLVRKFFHPSAFFNQTDRRELFSHLFGGSPNYVPDPLETPSLQPLVTLAGWQSCICLPLADHEDVIAMLTLASARRKAFGEREVGEIVPVKSIAALALSQHLYRTNRVREAVAETHPAPPAAAEFQERLQHLAHQAEALEQDNQAKAQALEAAIRAMEQRDRSSSESRRELERAKAALSALEEQSAAATLHLSEAYSQLDSTHARMVELERTVGFLREVAGLLAEPHDPGAFPQTLVTWFCEHFGIERCSIMLHDPPNACLTIAAQRGMDPELADKVRVRLGQGISGWVAHHRKPLFVRARHENGAVGHSGRDAYNSDSFISIPLVYGGALVGVLNLSNKPAGVPFGEEDLDRALVAAAILATVLGRPDPGRGAAPGIAAAHETAAGAPRP